MVDGVDFVNWGGVVTFFFGGFFWAVTYQQHKLANKLAAARRIEKLEELKELRDLSPSAPALVAVSGKTWSPLPLECELTEQKAVIAEIREEQHAMKKTPLGDWVRDDQQLRHSLREARWMLEDGSRVKLPIIGGMKARELCLELAGEDYKQPQSDWKQQFTETTFGGWRKLGNKRVERVLPVGMHLTAVGELVPEPDLQGTWTKAGAFKLPSSNSVLTLQAPRSARDLFVLTTRPLEDVVREAKFWGRVARTCAIGCSIVGAALVIGQAVMSVHAILRRRRLRRAQAAYLEARRRARESAAAGEQDWEAASSEHDRGANVCVVCFENPCDMVFTGCGHMCLCHGCSAQLHRCPICRTASRIMRVYQT